MITVNDLTERQKEILRSVVHSFIQSATPVGSKHLAQHFFVDLSPATIRNALAELEEKGYIDHPYTSAGRIPTDMGYRAYVDNLMKPSELTLAERKALEVQISAGTEAEELLQTTSKILGKISRQLSIVSSPHIGTGILERIELAYLSSTRILVILTMKSGRVRTITMEVTAEIPREKLDNVSRLLNERIAGLTLKNIRETFGDRIKDLQNEETGLIRLFIVSSRKLFDDVRESNRLYISGTKNILDQPEGENPEYVRSVFEILENEELIVHVLDQQVVHPESATVTIGGENVDRKFENYSLIVATYQIGDITGQIGLLGPKRMNYAKAVPLVDFTAHTISNSLS